MPDISFITGFPAFTARRMAQALVAKDRVRMLVAEADLAEVDPFLATLPPSQRKRVEIIEGEVASMDLGLPGRDYKALAADTTAVHHAAAVYHLGARAQDVDRVNVEGTRMLLDFASDCASLRRLVYWSNAQVSGLRSGVILEEELDTGQRFHDVYEETKFRAEVMVRAAGRKLPTTILRPGIIVGDSRTGEIDKFDGPYYLMVLIVAGPIDVHLPLPGRGSAPLNLVPIDFVIDAALQLSRDPRAQGGTFHLTDPCPFSARTVYELVAQRASRKAPRGSIPSGLARALLRAPGLERLARAPRAFLEAFNHLALYNCRHTLELLDGSGVRCPPFDSYVDQLVKYVQKVQAARKQREDEETVDPLE